MNVFETALHKVRRAPQRGADDSLRADDCSSEATDAVQHGEAMRLPAKHALKKMGAAAARGARFKGIQFNSSHSHSHVSLSHTGKESLLLNNS